MMNTYELFHTAYETRDINYFLDLIFPYEWTAIKCRILESGASFSNEMCDWAPKWSKIPPTIRYGKSELETYIKSCIFRVHDCLHQLWGLPHPDLNFTMDGWRTYKKSQMCGEVAVLTLTEFAFVPILADKYPDIKNILYERNAIPMLNGPLKSRTIEQIACRLDTLLHKKKTPSWVREHKESLMFCNDYVPMLQHDRECIDHNWNLMKNQNWQPGDIPNAPYSQNLDGLELTVWMIKDFYHQIDTGIEVDQALVKFNMNRRNNLKLPAGWNMKL